ncbi:MAG: HypC/HybG/HupF family hydrogenase formation chaperone [Pirellulaceae bacterium]|nr:HypC/HybG/HupF family hydrogenase formation chaperone [Pirellulaceae bacterium]
MCLGIPGKVVEVRLQDDVPMGRVEFGGILKDTCLVYTPEVKVGDYVLVHVGFAISVIDETEANETMDYLREIEAEIAEMHQADIPP